MYDSVKYEADGYSFSLYIIMIMPMLEYKGLLPHKTQRHCSGQISLQSRCISRPAQWTVLILTLHDFCTSVILSYFATNHGHMTLPNSCHDATTPSSTVSQADRYERLVSYRIAEAIPTDRLDLRDSIRIASGNPTLMIIEALQALR